MLWRSWRLLIEASNQRPDLVPVETWRRRLGRHAHAAILCMVT